jgi:hypothetical protein
MSVRQLKEVETFVRGKWIKTKGYVTSSEICRFPPCIRKIPSKRSRKRTSDAKIPNGYCSVACKQSHNKGNHLIKKLDEFIEERKD